MPWGFEAVLWIILIVSTVTDLRWGKIFNIVTLPTVAVGLIVRSFYGMEQFTVGALGVGAAFIFYFPLYFLKVFGAGDVKLLMAIGALSNARWVFQIGIFAIFVGALVGFVELIRQLGFVGSIKSLWKHLSSKKVNSVRIPYAPSFLCGTLIFRIGERYQWF